MDWILEHLGLVIFVVIVIAQLLRGVMSAKGQESEPERKPDELEEQRRVREIQEQIRRRIAERRGETPAHAPAPQPPPLQRAERPPPAAPRRPDTTQLPDVFEGPLRRVFEEIERRVQPPPPPAMPPPLVVEQRNAELVRQEQLAEELKALEQARAVAQRRAAQQAAELAAHAQSGVALRKLARDQLLADLHDKRSLRRAFVLREVLGPPVGMR